MKEVAGLGALAPPAVLSPPESHSSIIFLSGFALGFLSLALTGAALLGIQQISPREKDAEAEKCMRFHADYLGDRLHAAARAHFCNEQAP